MPEAGVHTQSRPDNHQPPEHTEAEAGGVTGPRPAHSKRPYDRGMIVDAQLRGRHQWSLDARPRLSAAAA